MYEGIQCIYILKVKCQYRENVKDKEESLSLINDRVVIEKHRHGNTSDLRLNSCLHCFLTL